MKKILTVLMGIMLIACGSKEQNSQNSNEATKNRVKKEAIQKNPIIPIYKNYYQILILRLMYLLVLNNLVKLLVIVAVHIINLLMPH